MWNAISHVQVSIVSIAYDDNHYTTGTSNLTHNLEDKGVHTFPKGISAMWNAISLVQVWTRVAVSIAYDDNHYTTGTSNLTHNWEDKRVHTFPKGICLKGNVIEGLEFDLAYYDSVVHRFNHYTTRNTYAILFHFYTYSINMMVWKKTQMIQFAKKKILHKLISGEKIL